MVIQQNLEIAQRTYLQYFFMQFALGRIDRMLINYGRNLGLSIYGNSLNCEAILSEYPIRNGKKLLYCI